MDANFTTRSQGNIKLLAIFSKKSKNGEAYEKKLFEYFSKTLFEIRRKVMVLSLKRVLELNDDLSLV